LLVQDKLYFRVQYTRCGIAPWVFDIVLHKTQLIQCFNHVSRIIDLV